MAAIDRDKLLADDKLWLPPSNSLSDAQMLNINEYIIADVGDDDSNYAEVLCKSLRSLAGVNAANVGAATGGIQKQRTDEVEVSYFDGSSAKQGWDDYIDSLRDICPIFGYYGLKAKGGIKITTSCPPDINPCCGDEY
jgi:hypothetical protein